MHNHVAAGFQTGNSRLGTYSPPVPSRQCGEETVHPQAHPPQEGFGRDIPKLTRGTVLKTFSVVPTTLPFSLAHATNPGTPIPGRHRPPTPNTHTAINHHGMPHRSAAHRSTTGMPHRSAAHRSTTGMPHRSAAHLSTTGMTHRSAAHRSTTMAVTKCVVP